MLKRIMALLLAALLLGGITLAEEDDFGFDFSDDGYTGDWTPVEALGVEFCLPDGWTESPAPEGAAYAAQTDGGAATLSIRLEQEGVEDIVAWGETHLDNYAVGDANFYEVLIEESPRALTLRFVCDGDRLIAFDFTRESEAALATDFALKIAGSTYESWIDEGFPMDDGEDFDFGDPFENAVG